MENILGFSHLVFTSHNKKLVSNSQLTSLYEQPEQYTFAHGAVKKKLLRTPSTDTLLSFYSSRDGDLPALELVYSESYCARDLNSYGLILPSTKAPEASKTISKRCLNDKINAIIPIHSVALIEELPCYLIYSEILHQNECTMGAWMNVNDLENTLLMYQKQLNSEIINQGDGIAIAKTRVINKKFTNFLWVLIEENNQKSYFNDDIGLSTLGWIKKPSPNTLPPKQINIEGLKLNDTKPFTIEMNGRQFNAAFYFDNQLPSFEILELKSLK